MKKEKTILDFFNNNYETIMKTGIKSGKNRLKSLVLHD